MKVPFYFSRCVALFLSVILALPPPALGLRTQNAGLEDNPRLNRQISATLQGNPSGPDRPRFAAGAEEHPLERILPRLDEKELRGGGKDLLAEIIRMTGNEKGDPVALQAVLIGFSTFMGAPPPRFKDQDPSSAALGLRLAHYLRLVQRRAAERADLEAMAAAESEEETMDIPAKERRRPYSQRTMEKGLRVDPERVLRAIKSVGERTSLTPIEIEFFSDAYRAENLKQKVWIPLAVFLKAKGLRNGYLTRVIRNVPAATDSSVQRALRMTETMGRGKELPWRELQFLLNVYCARNLMPEPWERLHGFLAARLPAGYPTRVVRRVPAVNFAKVEKAMEAIRRQQGESKGLTEAERKSFFDVFHAENLRPAQWKKLLNFLIEQNEPLVFDVLKRDPSARRQSGKPANVDDLRQAGRMGLREALLRYDPDKGGTLGTYAPYWIKLAIKREEIFLSYQTHIPRHMVSEQASFGKAEADLLAEGKVPSDEVIAQKLGWPEKHVRVFRKAFRVSQPISLMPERIDEVVGGSGVPADPEGVKERRALGNDVARLLEMLPPRLRIPLKVLYGMGMPDDKGATLAEIGRRMNLSRERVRQLTEDAKQEIRRVIANSPFPKGARPVPAGSPVPAARHPDVFLFWEMGVPFEIQERKGLVRDQPLFEPLAKLGRGNLERIWAVLSAGEPPLGSGPASPSAGAEEEIVLGRTALSVWELNEEIERTLPWGFDYYNGSDDRKNYLGGASALSFAKPWEGFPILGGFILKTERTLFDLTIYRGDPAAPKDRTYAVIIGRSAGAEEALAGLLKETEQALADPDPEARYQFLEELSARMRKALAPYRTQGDERLVPFIPPLVSSIRNEPAPGIDEEARRMEEEIRFLAGWILGNTIRRQEALEPLAELLGIPNPSIPGEPPERISNPEMRESILWSLALLQVENAAGLDRILDVLDQMQEPAQEPDESVRKSASRIYKAVVLFFSFAQILWENQVVAFQYPQQARSFLRDTLALLETDPHGLAKKLGSIGAGGVTEGKIEAWLAGKEPVPPEIRSSVGVLRRQFALADFEAAFEPAPPLKGILRENFDWILWRALKTETDASQAMRLARAAEERIDPKDTAEKQSFLPLLASVRARFEGSPRASSYFKSLEKQLEMPSLSAGAEETPEARFERALAQGAVRFEGITARVGGRDFSAEEIPELQKGLAELQAQGFFREDRETIAVLLDPARKRPSALQVFDQADIPAEAIPMGVGRVEVPREIGQAITTFIQSRLTSQDPVFLQKGLVSSEGEVRGWLPEEFRPPQAEPPPVVLTTPAEIRELVGLNVQTPPPVRLTALVIAAECRPGKLLIVEVFTIRDYKGRELLLLSA